MKKSLKRVLSASLASVFIIGALAGCGGGEKKADPKAEQKAPAKDEIVITVGNNLVAGKFDPTIGYGVWNADIFHAHLFKIGKDNALVQDLAVKETISQDGKVYTYALSSCQRVVEFFDNTVIFTIALFHFLKKRHTLVNSSLIFFKDLIPVFGGFNVLSFFASNRFRFVSCVFLVLGIGVDDKTSHQKSNNR